MSRDPGIQRWIALKNGDQGAAPQFATAASLGLLSSRKKSLELAPGALWQPQRRR
jgi:hypothetical protein